MNRGIFELGIILGLLGALIISILMIIVVALSIVTVSFNSNGGSTVEPQRVFIGTKIKEPENVMGPEGTELVGWFYNGELWDFNTDVAKDNMELKAEWKWDGQNPSYDWYDPTKYETIDKFYLNTGADLYGLALLTREGAKDFKNKDIIIEQDIFIDGKEWNPIGSEENPFRGNIIGNGNTIHGLTITDNNENLTGWDGALIGYAEGEEDNLIKIKDLKIDDVNIELTKKDGSNNTGAALAGWLINADVENVSASGKIYINTNAGTVAGIAVASDGKILMNNVVNNVEIGGTRYDTQKNVNDYFILGGIIGQTVGEGPLYFKNCGNNANIIMNNPFDADLTEYVGKYTPATIAGHIVGQASGSDRTRLVFDNCFKSNDALIYGAHSYKIEEDTNGYNLIFETQAPMQGKRYTGKTSIVNYGYTYIEGNTDISFKYGNETIYFVPTTTTFNLETINDDYKTKGTPGFEDRDNCFYLGKIATTPEDINAVAGGKWLISYSPGDNAIIYTFDR